MTPLALAPLSLGGVAPSAVVVVPPADVMFATPALISLIALEALGSSAANVVILELPSPVVVPREASVAEVVVLGGNSFVVAAVPSPPLPPAP